MKKKLQKKIAFVWKDNFGNAIKQNCFVFFEYTNCKNDNKNDFLHDSPQKHYYKNGKNFNKIKVYKQTIISV